MLWLFDCQRAFVHDVLTVVNEVLYALPNHLDLPKLSKLEIAGVGALLQSFYNGIENIIKQVLAAKSIFIPTGSSWQRDLINIAQQNGVISEETKQYIIEYLAFRNFVSHAYAFDLSANRLQPLIQNTVLVYEKLKRDLRPVLQ